MAKKTIKNPYKHTEALFPSLDDASISELKDASEPLVPFRYEAFAQAIVRNNGDVKKSCAEVFTSPDDPSYTSSHTLPGDIKRRVKHLLRRSASELVVTRDEVERLLSRVVRGLDTSFGKLDAIKELCKMKGWYSPVEIKQTHELKVPDRIAIMSDEELNKMIALGAQPIESSSPIEDAVVVDEPKEIANESDALFR